MTEGDPKARLLDAAETLFNRHGFAAVRLRDIAQAAGLHHATLYHHVPGGKVELYRAAMQRHLQRHAEALARIVDEREGDLRAQLQAVCDWLLASGAGNHARMLSTDLPALPPDLGQALSTLTTQGLFGPLQRAFRGARSRGEVQLSDEMIFVVSGSLLASLQAQQAAHAAFPGPFSARQQAHALVDVLLDGLRPRPKR